MNPATITGIVLSSLGSGLFVLSALAPMFFTIQSATIMGIRCSLVIVFAMGVLLQMEANARKVEP